MSSCNGLTILIILALFSHLFTTAQTFSCSATFNDLMTKNKKNITFTQCKKLTTLGAEFGWKYYNNKSQQIDIFFGAKINAKTGWLAWGVNPGEKAQMVGSRALIAIKQPNGTTTIDTYNITPQVKLGCSQLLPSNIDIRVYHMKAEYHGDTQYLTLFASLVLPPECNTSRLHLVWQVGNYAVGNLPMMHAATFENIDSKDTINLESGSIKGFGQHRHHMRMVHGILNIAGWGTLLPIGVILARYLRKFPVQFSRWFCLHVSCQILGYSLGTAGWIIGLWLGHTSKSYTFPTHRILAIFIFTFTTLQMLALRLKPSKNDEYRKYWNMYHHFLGYALIALIATNIFQGIKILQPDNSNWKWAYIGILAVLAGIVLALEIFTWVKFLTQKRNQTQTPDSSQPSKKKEQNK